MSIRNPNILSKLLNSYKVPQNQDFFFNPPKDENNNIVDTRSSRVMAARERNELLNIGRSKLQSKAFPRSIQNNHSWVSYSFRPTSYRIYGPRENGPHVQKGWEVKFETQDKTILQRIGIAIAWLMCNRQGFSIFMHPVTWEEGDYREELKAHEEYSFFLGDLPELELSFFSNKIINSFVENK